MTKITDAEKKTLKGRGFLPTKDGRFSARLITVNGKVNAEQAMAISQAAEKFGNGQVFYTTRLTVEIPGIAYEDIEAFADFMGRVGMTTGGTGSRVRPVVCCKGTVCVHGLTDTLALAERVHKTFYEGWYDVKLPHKFKIGIGGCPNNCVKPELHEFGIVAQHVPAYDADMCNGCKKCAPMDVCPVKALTREDGLTAWDQELCNNCGKCIGKCPFDCFEEEKLGFKLYVGGKWGKYPRVGSQLPGIYTEEEVMSILEKTLLLYREKGRTGERMGAMAERIGAEAFIEMILSDEILTRKQEILDAPLHLVGGATC